MSKSSKEAAEALEEPNRVTGLPVLTYSSQGMSDTMARAGLVKWKQEHYLHLVTRHGDVAIGIMFNKTPFTPPEVTLGQVTEAIPASAISTLSADDINRLRGELFISKIKDREKAISKLKEKYRPIFEHLWIHMSEESRAVLRKHTDYVSISSSGDFHALLDLVDVTHLVGEANPFAKSRARQAYQLCCQEKSLSLDEFKIHFDLVLRNLTAVGEALPSEEGQAADFISRLDHARFGGMIADMENDELKGHSWFPKTLTEAYDRASKWKVATSSGKPVFAATFVKDSSGGRGGRSGRGAGRGTGRGHHHRKDTESKRKPASVSTTESTEKEDSKKKTRECFRCHSTDHLVKDCPEPPPKAEEKPSGRGAGKKDGKPRGAFFCALRVEEEDIGTPADVWKTSAAQVFAALGERSSSFIGIDTMGGVSCVHDDTLLEDIRECPPVRIEGVGGIVTMSQCGILRGTELDAYYDAEFPVNLVSYARASDLYDIVTSRDNQSITLKAPSGDISFCRNEDDIYVAEITQSKFVAVSTVEGRRKMYTKKEQKRAESARILQSTLGASSADLAKICRLGVLANNSLTPSDIWRAEDIYGRDLSAIKGKTKRKAPPELYSDRTPREDTIITGFLDLFFVQDLTFLLCATEPVEYCFVLYLPRRLKEVLLNALLQLIGFFKKFGFTFKELFFDGESGIKPLQPYINNKGIELSISNNSPVGKAEAEVRVVKERMRGIVQTLPFRIPLEFVVYLVIFIIFGLNCAPRRTMSEYISPFEAVTGRKPDVKRDLALSFGQYVEIHERHDIINDMKSRTSSALALYPTGNQQGQWAFWKLDTNEVVTRTYWDPLPMPTAVVKLLDDYGEKRGVLPKAPTFRLGRRDGRAILLDDEVDQPTVAEDPTTLQLADEIGVRLAGVDFAPSLPKTPYYSDHHDLVSPWPVEGVLAAGAGVDEPGRVRADLPAAGAGRLPAEGVRAAGVRIADLPAEAPPIPVATTPAEAATVEDFAAIEDDAGSPDRSIEDDAGSPDRSTDADTGQPSTSRVPVEDVDPDDDNINSSPIPDRMPPPTAHSLRDRSKLKAPVRYAFMSRVFAARNLAARAKLKLKDTSHVFNLLLKKAREEWGDLADKATEAELRQMVTKEVWSYVAPEASGKVKGKVIPSKLFLKAKYLADGVFSKLKARLVAGGHLQDRSVYTLDDIYSPTASLASLYLVAGLAAKEGRKVASMDVAGAYLNADLKEDIMMRLEPAVAEVLLQMYPELDQYLCCDGSIVVKLRKALYGLAESGKLWNSTLIEYLKSLGFKQNGKDECVLNTYVDGVQCTVLIYVDDILCTCVKQDVIDRLYGKLRERFKEVTINHGPILSFLGQSFDWSSKGKCLVTMDNYTRDILSDCKVSGTAPTPAKEDLFYIDLNSKLLNTIERQEFHTVVARVLYMAIRVRPDLLTAITFLSSRVAAPTEQDQDKLMRVLMYLNATINLGIVLEPTKSLRVLAYIDAAFAVHKDFKSHTGGFISLGLGPVFARSQKQKLVSKSSTEAEIIAVSDIASQVLWTQQFMNEQDVELEAATIFQDNRSAIMMMETGHGSSNLTRHIGIRYYFVKDRIDSQELRFEWICGEDMLADMLTKPLQGEKFRRLRKLLMNHC